MGKQTMGTPCQAIKHRTDGKMYRLHTPQTPIARTQRYTKYHIDEFPMGMNMVVAVLAYTGGLGLHSCLTLQLVWSFGFLCI